MSDRLFSATRILLTCPVDADIASYDATFQAFFAACRANAECNRAVPNIEQKVTDVYNRLQQHPAMVTTANPHGGPDVQVLIDGDAAVRAMLDALQQAVGGPPLWNTRGFGRRYDEERGGRRIPRRRDRA